MYKITAAAQNIAKQSVAAIASRRVRPPPAAAAAATARRPARSAAPHLTPLPSARAPAC
jgi:hypothetical protein